jgi:hypothetical protein
MSLKIRAENSQRLHCCLCTEKFDSFKSDYQCPKCLRFICSSCLDDLKKVNLYHCPYCTAVIEMIDLEKEVFKSLNSLRTLILFYYNNKNWELVRFFSSKALENQPQ